MKNTYTYSFTTYAGSPGLTLFRNGSVHATGEDACRSIERIRGEIPAAKMPNSSFEKASGALDRDWLKNYKKSKGWK